MEYQRQVSALINAVVHGDSAAMLPLIKPARHNEILPKERLGVYRNGYLIRMEGAMEVDYPAFVDYIGKDEALRLIEQFVRETPSTHWDLNLYSVSFPAFLSHQKVDPAAQEVAQLESAITEIFWGRRDGEAANKDWQSLSVEELGGMKFVLNPTIILLAFDYAANAYLQAWREDSPPEVIEKNKEYICAIRYQNEVKRVPLTQEAYVLLSAIPKADTFEDALLATAEHEAIDPQILVAQLPEIMQLFFEYGMILPA